MSQEQPDGPEPLDDPTEPRRFSANGQEDRFVLRLYVTGLTPRSTQAINAIKELCEEELHGRYELEIFDLAKQPELAQAENIIAAPTLVKSLPLPLRRLIGDLSNRERVLLGLDLRPRT